MNRSRRCWSVVTVLLVVAAACGREPAPAAPPSTASAATADPLPSWNDGATKKAIVDFVARVTRQGGPDFVPPAERIATFDNDGTLWAEQPLYFQLLFALDRVKALAPQHPEWKQQQPFKGVLEGDSQGRDGERRARHSRAHGRHARRQHQRGVREDRQRLDRDRPASEVQSAVHGDGVPADARGARLPSRQRLQDVHRVRRRRGIHEALGGTRVWDSARAGRREQSEGEVRGPQRRARYWRASRRSITSTTRRGSPSASTR